MSFVKTFNDFQFSAATYFTESFTLDVWQSFEYVSEEYASVYMFLGFEILFHFRFLEVIFQNW